MRQYTRKRKKYNGSRGGVRVVKDNEEYIIFLVRVSSLRKAAERAKDPEWKRMWEQKLEELIQNEESTYGTKSLH